MSVTRIADAIEPSLFAEYYLRRAVETSAFWQSGVVGAEPRIAGQINGGGRLITMPFWTDVTGTDDEVLSDSAPLTPAKIESGQDIAHVLWRGKAFSASDLVAPTAGSDPMRAIGDQVGDFWRIKNQATLVAICKGLLASGGALASTHVHDASVADVSSGVPDNAKFSDDYLLEASYKLGDRESSLSAIAVHSVIEKRMKQLNLIDYVKPSEAEAAVPFYRGKRVIVDDDVPKVAVTGGFAYYSILFGAGAIAYHEGNHLVPTEADRDKLAGYDYLITRRTFVLHPRGVKFIGTPAGATPTNAELSNTASWQKAWLDKQIRIAALITNG